MPNLRRYSEKILSDEDKTLFQEAVISASRGAPRGAYILIWLSAAESLKRKFREASLRDGEARRIVGLIQQSEDQHKSVDMLILNKAKDYGFIDDAAYQRLKHVYDLRCLYGHPYESAPSDIELTSAADTVTNDVLSKPTTLRHGFVQRVVTSLSQDPNYLEHSKAAVQGFAREIVEKTDPTVYAYLLEKYAEFIEASYADPTLNTVIARGRWFLSEFLAVAGTDFYTSSQWHDFCAQYPNTAQSVLTANISTFSSVGIRAGQYVINYLLANSGDNPSMLRKLQGLIEANVLNERQIAQFNQATIYNASNAKLKVNIAFEIIISALKSYNWYTQNAAADLVKLNVHNSLSSLSDEQASLLGRNILQAAEGTAGSAITLIQALFEDQADVPEALYGGIVLESFLNESNQFRIKASQIDNVLGILHTRPELIAHLNSSLVSATPKGVTFREDFEALCAKVIVYPELAELHSTLVENQERLRTPED